MEKFKPDYLGKVLPDKKDQMTKLLDQKYDAFNKVYSACKDESAGITDIKNVSSDDSDSLEVKLICSQETSDRIKENVSAIPNAEMSNDTIKIPSNNE